MKTPAELELEKQMRALAAEAAEKALNDRDATRSTNATPVPVVAAKSATALEVLGAKLQASYARKALAQNQMPESEAKMFIERAANLTATSGLELNGPKRSPELIQAVCEKSFLLANGAELWDGYETQMNCGKWGGFTVSAVTATGSPSENGNTTADISLLSYFGAAKLAVANALLANPRAGATLAEDLLSKLALFVDTMIVSGSGSANQAVSIKSQASSSPDHTVACTANAVTVAAIVADIAAGLAAIEAAGHDTKDAIIVTKPATFYSLVALRDSAGAGFPGMQGEDPRILGRKVISHTSVGSDTMILVPSQLMVGLPLPPNAGVGLEGTDLSAGTSTVFGRVGYDGKLKNSTAVYFITGTGAADGWFDAA